MLKLGEKGVVPQRDKKTYAIAPHIPCGVITPQQLRTIADVADKYEAQALKLTSASRIAMVGLKEEDIDNAWKDLSLHLGHAVGLCVRSIKACPGTTFCKLAQQDSLGMGMKLDEIYHGMELPSKTKMGVSGCTNQCAENCIKDISLMGKKSGWTLMVGGNGASRPRLAEVFAQELDSDTALDLIEKIVAFYKENGKKGERIGKMIDRLGLDTMKDAILA
ncbi:Nitrite/Sulfite reductase ferredoxin-like half domain-containing protein [Desulfocicer vacuolatum DSM 3385]|uniref:Nitrite/Sulfite reductase ferredoxin-like half domain-containing protein n=1 Tax=Desulfocicer vacuolatum DSM 3385 TaxID=1121400 RepID=A0A1W1YNW5_9BACT|nr:NAD(P)/FAD-dependent oxidoreductase [Desulfocicer vacuolatum]SMC37849.1 Nitrite/Sulfite reductase ferredoxin-like half domain-containing protein [Desulfocicer vacuolatum DSM 3385]